MFKKATAELDALRLQAAEDEREKERARLALQTSAKMLRQYLKAIPAIDEAIEAVAKDIASTPKE